MWQSRRIRLGQFSLRTAVVAFMVVGMLAVPCIRWTDQHVRQWLPDNKGLEIPSDTPEVAWVLPKLPRVLVARGNYTSTDYLLTVLKSHGISSGTEGTVLHAIVISSTDYDRTIRIIKAEVESDAREISFLQVYDGSVVGKPGGMPYHGPYEAKAWLEFDGSQWMQNESNI